jgi:transposase
MPNSDIDLSRSFSDGRKWRLWNGPRLDAVIPGAVKFYDDLGVTLEEAKWYVGVEVHELVLVAAVYGRSGDTRLLGPICREDTTPEGHEALQSQLVPFHPVRFLMETSGVYHIPVFWHLREAFPESQVVVMNSTDLSFYIRGTRKNDLIDATKIAQVASFDELIKPSYVPEPSQYVFRELARYRDSRATELARQKNRVKKVLAVQGLAWDINFQSQEQCRLLVDFLQQAAPFGAFVGAWQGRLRQPVRKQLAPWGSVTINEEGRQLILPMVRDLAVSEELLKLTEARLELRAHDNESVQAAARSLLEFPGIGHVECLNLLAEIGNVARFPTAGHLLVYAGIAPRGGTSGVQEIGSAEETVVEQDAPNRMCSKRLKNAFNQVAVAILRNCNRTDREDDLYHYARAIRVHPMKKKQRINKVAAKVGRKLYHLLTTGEQYCGTKEQGTQVATAEERHSRASAQRQRYRKEREARVLADRKVEVLVAKLRDCGVDEDSIHAILEVA